MSTLSCLLVVVVKYNAASTPVSKSAVRREWDLAAAKLKTPPWKKRYSGLTRFCHQPQHRKRQKRKRSPNILQVSKSLLIKVLDITSVSSYFQARHVASVDSCSYLVIYDVGPPTTVTKQNANHHRHCRTSSFTSTSGTSKSRLIHPFSRYMWLSAKTCLGTKQQFNLGTWPYSYQFYPHTD